jgi:hypothetical protein
MNWAKREKTTKEVQIRLEWTNKSDLTLILSDLRDLIASGIETHHGDRKSVENEGKTHKFEFMQYFVHERPSQDYSSVEKDINGELKLVIKSKI